MGGGVVCGLASGGRFALTYGGGFGGSLPPIMFIGAAANLFIGIPLGR